MDVSLYTDLDFGYNVRVGTVALRGPTMPGLQERRPAPTENSPTTDTPDLWQRLEVRLREGASRNASLWPRLAERLDAAQPPPRLRPGILLKPARAGRSPTYLLGDPAAGRYFLIGEREAGLLALLDGQRGLAEIVQESAARLDPIPVEAIAQFLQELRLAGLLDEPASLWRRLGYGRPAGLRVLWTWPEAEGKVAALYRRLRFLFHPAAWALPFALLGIALTLLALGWGTWLADLRRLGTAWWLLPSLLAALYVAALPIALLHELAHALACTHLGGSVSRLGLMLQHFLPAAFADVSDVALMPRRSRIAVFLAGPAAGTLWPALGSILWACAPPGTWPHLYGALLLLAGLWSLVVGLCPVAGYDGSEVLAEVLGLPDLHRRALHYLWTRLRRRPAALSARERRIFRVYVGVFLFYNIAMLVLIALLLWQALRP